MYSSVGRYIGYLVVFILTGGLFVNIGISIGANRADEKIAAMELQVIKLKNTLDEYTTYNQYRDDTLSLYIPKARPRLHEENVLLQR